MVVTESKSASIMGLKGGDWHERVELKEALWQAPVLREGGGVSAD